MKRNLKSLRKPAVQFGVGVAVVMGVSGFINGVMQSKRLGHLEDLTDDILETLDDAGIIELEDEIASAPTPLNPS